jgi:hypothetical protein
MTQMSRCVLGGKTAVPSFSTVRPRKIVTRAARQGLWLPDTEPPAHLKGDLPGDRGFDPLGLGSEPDRLKWCVGLCLCCVTFSSQEIRQ